MDDGPQALPPPPPALEPEPISRSSSTSTQGSVLQDIPSGLPGIAALASASQAANSPQHRLVQKNIKAEDTTQWIKSVTGASCRTRCTWSGPFLSRPISCSAGRFLFLAMPRHLQKKQHATLPADHDPHGMFLGWILTSRRPVAIAPAMYPSGTSPASTHPGPGGNLVSAYILFSLFFLLLQLSSFPAERIPRVFCLASIAKRH